MSHKHNGVFALYDISSSSVAGAHVLVHHETCPSTTLLASVRSETMIRDDINIERFVADTNTRLQDVVNQVRAADVHHPSFIQVVLASPWYTAQTRTIIYKKEVPFTCTSKLIESLVDAEIKHVLAETEGPFGTYGEESLIVEKQLSGIKLNGYLTHTPYGKKTLTIEFSLILTIAPKRILETFTDTLKRSYGVRAIRYTTNTFSTFVVMRDRLSVEHACVVIDVGEEITDVAFVKGGTVLYQHSFPMGTFGLYRALGKHDIDVINESQSILEAYRLGKLTPTVRRKVEKSIQHYTDKWQEGFRGIIEQGSFGYCLPEQLLVSVDPRFELLFARMISEDPFIKYKCAADDINLIYLNDSVLASDVSTVDHVAIDSSLVVGALFAERMHA